MPKQKQPVDVIILNGKKHLTKSEIETRRAAELTAPSDNLVPPSWLKKKQRAEFEKLSEELAAMGLMSNLDCETLAQYVQTKDRVGELNRILSKPEVKEDLYEYEKFFNLWTKGVNQLQSIAKSMGMTMDSRCKLSAPPAAPAAADDDKWLYG